ncbi:MAG: ABC transporter substrate-binding protein [Myxococcales bacterium]|nr:ABC transporter substrate-binding protein [Myxococcales bacterium]
MRFRPLPLAVAASSLLLALAPPAWAADAQGFIQAEHAKLDQLLRQPPAAARDAQIDRAMDGFVDFDVLARRAFGEPCPASVPSCEDLWAKYTDAQRTELKDLLTQLVRKSYRKNLVKTLDYDVDYRGQRDEEGETRVLTEARNKTKPRDPTVRVDYVVKQTPDGYRVVDIITEGSSLTKNYYEQFRKKMNTPGEGYPNIVQKLHEKIEKKD